uniref:Glycosyltransferase 2-like domain-containing protein n=1 Tax=Panagrolaimus sp. JU765 TaxID=591449 RepID=A0AC34Q0T3_9BILA
MTSYAINSARNFGKSLVETPTMIVADLDHLFSPNFEQKLRKFATEYLNSNNKTVLVYRIFEITKDSPEPKNKKDLAKLLENGTAREFHVENQNETLIEMLDEWLNISESDQPSIQFYKNYSNSYWEPQFISRQDIPDFDERFKYPMRDNTVLVS